MMNTILAALAVWGSVAADTRDAAPTLWDADRNLPAVFLDDVVQASGPIFFFRDKDDEPRQARGGGFAIGPMGGYLKTRGADRGTWFGGVQARLYFLKVLAAEASISFHQDRFNDGDTLVTQYPVQVSGMLFPLPELPVQPYIVAGAGWYYTRIDNRRSLDFLGDETDHWFGGHVGAGAEIAPSRAFSLFVDFRYIFIDPESDIEGRSGDADYWQITFGVGFGF